jgi:hypothetical protein
MNAVGYGRKPCAIIHWAVYASPDDPAEFVLACPCCRQLVWASSHCGGGPEVLAQPASVSTTSSKVTHLMARIVPLHGLPRMAIGRRISHYGRLTERRGTIVESASTCAFDNKRRCAPIPGRTTNGTRVASAPLAIPCPVHGSRDHLHKRIECSVPAKGSIHSVDVTDFRKA